MTARKHTHVDTETERRAPTVVEGTLSAKEARAFADDVAASTVDPRLWTGAFATNVWGGRFAVDGVLGAGSQGTTFAGRDLKTGTRVAVKVFDLGRARDWKSQELFEREVQVLKSIEHPGVPKFLEVIVDEDTGARALVRTLIPGESLAAVMKRDGAMREAALWHVLVDAADVLGALHSRSSPIVHRDIKPSNLIKRDDGKVCLVDFGGVGRMRENAGSTVVGTFGYMAPEQLYGAQTPATDMYSLGATLLALATGQEPEELPRDGLSLDVDKAAPGLSEKLRALLKQLTAPDPKARPQDAAALLSELKSIASARVRDDSDARDADHAAFLDGLDGIGERVVDVHNDGAATALAFLQLVVSVLGVAGAVVVGQVLLPLLLTILAAVSASPEQRAKLHRARDKVRATARLAKGALETSALHGARKLEEVNDRERHRKRNRKARKHQRRRER